MIRSNCNRNRLHEFCNCPKSAHCRRQGYFKYFLIPGDEAVKIVQVQFLDIASFLSRCRTNIQRQNEINKKLGSHVAASRVSVNTP